MLSAISASLREAEVKSKHPYRTLFLSPNDLPPVCRVGIVFLRMYKDFHATDRWTKKQVHCLYQALIVAVATRHADAVDIKFLVDGRPVWVALPLPAWAEYQKRTKRMITDPLAIEIAGHYLKTALETGEGVGREMYSLTVAETLNHLESLVKEETEATA